MQNQLTFLGTGTSQGVPVIACPCEVCHSTDPRDKRLRTSVHLDWNDLSIVIDSGPDFRQQMLREKINRLDALLFTHEHNDHIIGIDDIRPFNFRQGGEMPVYANKKVSENLLNRFSYIFDENPYPGAPRVKLNTITEDDHINIENNIIKPVKLNHGMTHSFGYQFDSLFYLTDMKTIDADEMKKLEHCDTLIVNCLRLEPHFSHLNLKEALEFIDKVQPKRAYLTHISHLFGKYEEIAKMLPQNIFLAYDGLKIDF